ncbi:glycosyl hydrolase 2 galactose-binding domain-containing protein [Paraburkholderia phenoliruptrix]|uniref:glycosyl hydrolase 2 galactose-binding domain-containing protein n=1 Tax=Paraburkholderia phenoliruptrix TaxID=252970 RepID=UPI001C4E3358|nr:glycoside hydrolase family 2 protein [Paraburkholderia phenoliruptrix]MBW0447382.1 glycoside hydrolase family 2 protein [Paraburkholderia phenoliruptrix]MBW9098938.1 glycoside hydrolase family 2 protein [Paraburkholderia phenoliruptrix]
MTPAPRASGASQELAVDALTAAPAPAPDEREAAPVLTIDDPSAHDEAHALALAFENIWPQRLDTGWECVSTPAGACASPDQLPADGWLAAQVPGTVASARRAAGLFDVTHPTPLAFDDHWYRLTLRGTGKRRLRMHGLATIAEVWVDGIQRLNSDSMFVAHSLDIELNGSASLAICFRSLTPALAAKRPRARWRPRLVTPPTLRNVRTTLLGHMPGWCPAVHAVGPWRPVELLGDARSAIDSVDLTSALEGDDGIVSLTLHFVHPQDVATVRASLGCSSHVSALQWIDAYTLTGTVRVPQVQHWWPHTHGTPTLYPLTLHLDDSGANSWPLGSIGFRQIEVERGAQGTDFTLRVNGVPVFCRGACWTSADLVTLAGSEAQLRHAFELARDAGMNMLRVGGTMVYESQTFYALADEYGLLIWQDFALANFDYPNDAAFSASIDAEATQFLRRTRRHVSLAVLCGGSEAAQQAAMYGLPPSMRAQPVFDEQLPALVARERPDVPYVCNSPSGGVWPFSTNEGITHYYGVGAYQRPLDDVRRSQVRFAAECLAFANVPDDATLHEALGTIHPHDPRWKAAVPRDPGAGWDFDDVRDHYLQTLYGVDPARLRYEDPMRYLALSRALVAEVMGEVFAEWRRAGSGCGGGLVWQLQDLRPGAGWGLIDATGRPKSALHGLTRMLQPIQVLFTDEGLNGLDIHLINERADTLHAQLELVCLRDGCVKVASATRAVQLAPRSAQRIAASTCLDQFFDFTYAYRFGPRAHDVSIATLRDAESGQIISEAFHLPDRRLGVLHDPGLTVAVQRAGDGWQLLVEAKRFARFVHIIDRHYRAAHDWFHLAPNRPCIVPLVPLVPFVPRAPLASQSLNVAHASNAAIKADATYAAPAGEVRALNAASPTFYG